ncbi:hypothetical protein E7Z54_15235 [Nocardioides sp.]|nr:hypothetical protein E7Z54_15235 [Nocardioides sp.]
MLFLITGVSIGLGRAFAAGRLDARRNDAGRPARHAATARSPGVRDVEMAELSLASSTIVRL